MVSKLGPDDLKVDSDSLVIIVYAAQDAHVFVCVLAVHSVCVCVCESILQIYCEDLFGSLGHSQKAFVLMYYADNGPVNQKIKTSKDNKNDSCKSFHHLISAKCASTP